MKQIKRAGLALTAIMLVFAMILAGCGKKEEPVQETLEKAIQASMNMESYEFESTLRLKFNLSDTVLNNDPSALMVSEMLNNAELKVRGVYRKDPLQTEMTIDIGLKGDFAMNISVPIIMTEETLYIKIPNIPFFAGLIPPNLVNKYIMLDMNELAELSGEEIVPSNFNIDQQQKLGLEILQLLTANLSEEDYLTKANATKDLLPDGVSANEIITFTLNEDNFNQAVSTFVRLLPQMLDIMAKDEYKDLFPLTQEEIDELKAELDSEKADLETALDELKETLKINEFSIVSAIDKDYRMPYQQFKLDMDITEDGETTSIALTFDNVLTNINKKPEFKLGIPEGDDVLSITDLQNEIMGQMMSF